MNGATGSATGSAIENAIAISGWMPDACTMREGLAGGECGPNATADLQYACSHTIFAIGAGQAWDSLSGWDMEHGL
jgi:hypothetical protein